MRPLRQLGHDLLQRVERPLAALQLLLDAVDLRVGLARAPRDAEPNLVLIARVPPQVDLLLEYRALDGDRDLAHLDLAEPRRQSAPIGRPGVERQMILRLHIAPGA